MAVAPFVVSAAAAAVGCEASPAGGEGVDFGTVMNLDPSLFVYRAWLPALEVGDDGGCCVGGLRFDGIVEGCDVRLQARVAGA